MMKHGVPKVNFKGFMADNVFTNWSVIGTIYNEGDPSLPMVGFERTCLFH